MKSVNDLITAALGRSTFNDPDDLATTSEMIAVLDRAYKQFRTLIAGEHPTFFGETADVEGDGTKWDRPSGALTIVRVEAWGAAGDGGERKIDTQGTNVAVVPFDDREAELSPRVYEFGRAFYTEGGTSNPSAATNGDQLRIYYAPLATDLTAKTTKLDDDWPEQYDDLLILRLARYLAIKDGARETEIQALDSEADELVGSLVAWLETETFELSARHHASRSVGAP